LEVVSSIPSRLVPLMDCFMFVWLFVFCHSVGFRVVSFV